ncbi:MAG: hypothetical protein PHD21_00600, partial [Flavobacteriales bacterium]|nr:hypothetical protein [Flavobacteriales bacterium]
MSYNALDTLRIQKEDAKDTVVISDSTGKKTVWRKFIDYFKNANQDKTTYKKFDFSILGGPHYSSDTEFGIGLVASGLYRQDISDTLTPPSNLSVYADVSTIGFYLLGIRG